MVKRARAYPLLFLLILTFALLQLRILDADPPYNLSKVSMGEFGDPGSYALNARNKVVLGHWEADRWNLMYTNPIPHILSYIVFRFMGVSFFSLNLVPLLFAILSIWIALLLFQQLLLSWKTAFFFTLALSFHYLFLCYSKIANRIMPMGFFIILSVYLLERAKGKKPILIFLAGVSLFASFLSKGKMAYLFPIFPLALLIYRKENLWERLKELGYFLLGILSAFLPWYFFLYLPHREIYILFGSRATWRVMKIHSLANGISNFVHQPLVLFYPYMLLLSITALAGLAVASAGLYKKNLPFSVALSIMWLPALYLFLSAFSLRPIRYYFEIIYPMFILAAFLLRENSARVSGLIPFLVKYFLYLEIFLLIVRISGKYRLLLKPSLFFPFLLLPALPALIPFRLKFPKVLVYGLLVGNLLWGLRVYIPYYIHPKHRLRDISRDLGKAFPPSDFAGLTAPVLSMENRHIPHVSWPTHRINYEPDFPYKKKIKFAVLLTYNGELNYYFSRFPSFMNKLKTIARFYLWKTDLLLMAQGRETNLMEAETLKRKGGYAVYEGEASGGWTLFLPSELKGEFLSFIPSGPQLKLRFRGESRCVWITSEEMKTLLPGTPHYTERKFLVPAGKEISFYKKKGCKFWIDYIEGGEN